MTRPWTDSEMNRLRVMAKAMVSAYYIAKKLGRTEGSVKLQSRSLGLILQESEGEREMTRPWTEAETRRLRALARKKVSAEDIARSLGRHAGPVKRKARELGMILFKKQRHKVLPAVELGLRTKK
jgi:hypothetical protein